MIRLAIRGYAAGEKQFEDLLVLDDEQLETHLSTVAENHAEALGSHALHMIEIEFLDEPNPLQRFFRFGSDPRLMRRPRLVNL
jgi:hypothetical protein